MNKVKFTNPELMNNFILLRKQSFKTNSKIWRDIAKKLVKPNRKRIVVNLSRLNRYSKENEIVAIPGKVLGAGKINHPLKVVAFSFSEKARYKIESSKGECLSFSELFKKNPNGSGVKIIG